MYSTSKTVDVAWQTIETIRGEEKKTAMTYVETKSIKRGSLRKFRDQCCIIPSVGRKQ